MGVAMDWKEGRRLRAYELKQDGWRQDAIAEALGVSKGAVSKWLARARDKGVDGLRRQPPPGAQSRLSAEQLAGLPEVLAKGAEAYGFRGAVWTRERVRNVIEQVYGVRYHIDHMSYLMKKIGWTRQKPGRRATQQNVQAVADWQAAWPEVEKKPSRLGKR